MVYRRWKKIPYSKMSVDKLVEVLSDMKLSLLKAKNNFEKANVEYERNLTKKEKYNRLTNEIESIKKLAFERLGSIRKIITHPSKPSLNFDEEIRINRINEELDALNYKSYLSIPSNSHIKSIQDRIDKIESILLKKESKKIKKNQERAIVAQYKGESRRLAATIKKQLSNQVTEFPDCPYCNGPLGHDPHCDHIYPISHGGLSKINNMVFICKKCNMKKKDQTLREFIEQNGLNRDDIEKILIQLDKKF
jgi:5-methylcytosine-specific restriction endonuclease McrA